MAEFEKIIRISPDGPLYGRTKILTDKEEITDDNVVEVVTKALALHGQNRREIDYLYGVYRGRQDIRHKRNPVRPETNNIVVVNRANEIIAFKSAYFLSEAPQYVSAGGKDDVSEQIELLNTYMRSEDKESKDKSLLDWVHIAGVGVRMVLPDELGEEEGSPACIYTLDPREAFVIYYSGIGQKPLAGVVLQRDEEGNAKTCVYTRNKYYEIQSGAIVNAAAGEVVVSGEYHYLGRVPVVEYLNNDARMGAFEVVLPLLNAINTLESNRVDNIQDFVNAFDVFLNCELPEGAYSELTSGGKAIMIKNTVQGVESKVYRITSELNQSGAQTVVDDMNEAILEICGMPNRNGGSSTSDTGAASQYRDGWVSAESRAKDTEKLWNRSEREMLRVFLGICRDTVGLDLTLADIKIEHSRNNLANMQSRMQVLCEGLNNSKIHPKIPWQLAGIPNAEENYRISMEFYEEQQRELERSLREEMNDARGTISGGGRGDGASDEPRSQEVRAS